MHFTSNFKILHVVDIETFYQLIQTKIVSHQISYTEHIDLILRFKNIFKSGIKIKVKN